MKNKKLKITQKVMSREWNNLPHHMKNDVIIHTNNQRKIRTNKTPLDKPGEPLQIIFDDYMFLNSAETEYNKIFDTFIDYSN
jgi:hypothetical protein